MKKIRRKLSVVLIAAVLFFGNDSLSMAGVSQKAGALKVQASISAQNVAVGKQISVHAKTKKVKYVSSNPKIASVTQSGTITGKKAGTVTIQVKRSGYQAASFSLEVTNSSRMPSLPVALDEVQLSGQKLAKNSSGKMIYSAVVQNRAAKGTVKKIVYYYTVKAAVSVTADSSSGSAVKKTEYQTKTVTLTAKNIKPKKKSARVSCTGDYTGKLSAMKLQKIKLYTGEALYSYNVSAKKTSLRWATADKKAPEFSGWVGKNSCNGSDIYRVYYSDRKKTYNFKKYVSAEDERDGKVAFTVDTSGINWKKDGVYKIRFSAKDKAGNVGTAWAKVQVYVPGTAESIADTVLKSITKKSASDEKKARAIYKYVKGHGVYVDNGTHKDWRTVAVNGIRYRSGDCYTFYSMTRLLLTRAGIPNIQITRYPSYEGYHHWWNLVYVEGGWYHLDTTPRRTAATFCLITDAQLSGWKGGSSSTFRFQTNAYPKRAKKKISPNP